MICFAKNLHETDKLKFISITCLLIGYVEAQKGYIWYDTTKKNFVNRDVIFKKDIFPFRRKQKNPDLIFKFTSTNHIPDYLEEIQGMATKTSQQDIVPEMQGKDVTNMQNTTKALQQINDSIEEQVIQVTQVPSRQSTRGSRLPLRIKDFVSLNIHEGQYSLDKSISYDNLAPNYKYYLSKMSSEVEP